MKITTRTYYDRKHQRWVIEHRVSQYFPMNVTKADLASVEKATEAYLKAGLHDAA